jgi:hypothetical protein
MRFDGTNTSSRCARWAASLCAAPSSAPVSSIGTGWSSSLPVITGSSGRDRIHDDYPHVSLELVGNRTFDGHLQLLEYVPTVLAGPPSSKTDGT